MKIVFNRPLLFALFCVILIGVSQTTEAQDDTLINIANDSSSSIVDYPAIFFARYKPNTALDMVQQVPGFQVDDGDASRGFAGAAGNLLINGNRPSAKQDRPSAILSRIPASQVITIKLIRGQAKGIDLRGQTTVVDVLLSNDSTAAISWEGYLLYSTAAPIKPGIKASLSDHWRDIEYNLGIEIERDANGEFGNEYIFDENKRLIEERNEVQKETGLTTGVFMNASAYLGDAFINVNGKFGMGNSPEDHTSSRLPIVGDPREIFTRDDQHSKTYELGIDAERNLSEDITGKLILLFINRLSDVTSTQTSSDFQGSQLLFRQADTVSKLIEGIVRFEVDWSGLKNHAIQFNLEGAYNDLDGSLFQTEDTGAGALIVDIPGGNTRVEESRGDFLLKDTWSLRQFELDYGLCAEVSTITQSGDEEQKRSFFFLTPQGSLSFSPVQGQQTRFRLAREIAQLNFNDFISTTVF